MEKEISEKMLKSHTSIVGIVCKDGVVLGGDRKMTAGSLVMSKDEKKLKNILCDSHNQGGVWNMAALFIMDVYEHAYFIDYATGRKAYIEAFFKNVDWNFVGALAEKYRLA